MQQLRTSPGVTGMMIRLEPFFSVWSLGIAIGQVLPILLDGIVLAPLLDAPVAAKGGVPLKQCLEMEADRNHWNISQE